MRSWLWAAATVTTMTACGGDTERGIKSDSRDATDATTTTATDATGDVAPETETVQTALPNACDAERTCQKGACRAGVCVEDPPPSLVSHATNPEGNVPTDTWPDLSCVDQISSAIVAAPQTATLYGAVTRFGKGRATDGITVEVLRLTDFDPTSCEGLTDEDEVKACFRGLGPVVGTTKSVKPPTDVALPDVCKEHEECPIGYQCNDPADLGGECVTDFGLFEIAEVPLETPLVIRAFATTNESNWHDTWTFNVVLHGSHVVDGRIQFDATMVSHGQWLLVTNTVSLPEIPPTHGAIGGRIRDCRMATGEDGWPIANVRLALANPAKKIVYFNDLEDDTVPLVDRAATDIIGRYAALDVEPGWNRVAGAARVDGQVVSVGGADVYVIPNALSLVSFPGTQPYWRQR